MEALEMFLDSVGLACGLGVFFVCLFAPIWAGAEKLARDYHERKEARRAVSGVVRVFGLGLDKGGLSFKVVRVANRRAR